MAAKLTVVVDPIDIFIAGITNLPQKYLVCRETQHRWPEEMSPFHVVDCKRDKDRRPRGGFYLYAERTMTCDRCGMVRSDAYQISSFRGRTALHRINSAYTQPEGYAIPGVGQNAVGMRSLLHGVLFDQAALNPPAAKRSRPRKPTA